MAQGAPNSAATRWMPGRINSVLSVGAFQALKTQPRQPAQAVTSVPRPSSLVASMCSGQPPSASSAARKAGDCFWCKASRDRKSTRLNSSHQIISYAVFCLKKKKKRADRAAGVLGKADRRRDLHGGG